MILERIVSIQTVAAVLSYHQSSIWRALAAGAIRGIRISLRHYTATRPIARRARWRIDIDSVDEMLSRATGDTLPIRRRVRKALLAAAAKQARLDAAHDHVDYLPGNMPAAKGGGGSSEGA